MEEIDIIELLKRVKEGNAPKRIEINDRTYELYNNSIIEKMYIRNTCEIETVVSYSTWFEENCIELDTKIKILDKPIIEKIEIGEYETEEILKIKNKLNEVIDKINKENKE